MEVYLIFSIFTVSIFSHSLKILLFCDTILYLFLFKKKLIINFHKIIEKYFYFILAIFISYFFIAWNRHDFYIFIEYLKSALILTLKIFSILMLNIIIINTKKFKEKFPNALKIRIDFLLKMVEISNNELNNLISNYKSKIELIKNLNNIISNFIVIVVEKSLADDT